MKFKKTTLLSVLALLCLNFYAFAQVPIIPLKVGDKMPDFFWQQEHTIYANGKTTKQTLAPYKGKLLILDFWSSYCIPCIEAFPKLSALNREYASKVEILSLGREETVAGLRKVTSRLRVDTMYLTQVLRNRYIEQLFPYTILPHLVWIYNNEVIAITNGEQLNSNSIAQVMGSDGSVAKHWYQKADWLYRGTLPLARFGTDKVPSPKILLSSSFSSFIEGVSPPAGRKVDSAGGVARLNMYNQPILAFCWLAFSGTMSEDTSAVEFHVVDRARFIRPKPTTVGWQRQNAYCYELVLPLAYQPQKNEEMIRSDITNWLGVLGIQLIPIKDNPKKKFVIVEKGGAL